MKALIFILLGSLVARAAEAPTIPHVVAEPFEPPIERFFAPHDKFAHPPETVAPRFSFPFEFRRGGGAVTPGEVIILVQLDGHGSPKTLKVLASRHEHFTRSAIAALRKAKWDSVAECWFYYRHIYALEEDKPGPNQPTQRNAGSRPTSGDSPSSETPSSLGPRG